MAGREADAQAASTHPRAPQCVMKFSVSKKEKKSCGEPWPSSVFTFQLGSGGKISRECCAG